MKRWADAPDVGELRPSQMIFTYGPGSIVELPNMAAIVMGIQEWDDRQFQEIGDPRLLHAVRAHLGEEHDVQKLLSLGAEHGKERAGQDKPVVQVPVVTFPSWLRCTSCNLLARVDSGLFEPDPQRFRTDLAMHRHIGCRGKARTVPPPYLRACENGHLDDFAWSEFVHRGPSCAQPQLELRQTGAADSVANVFVRCRSCGAKDRPLAEAYGEQAKESLGTACTARRPHMDDYDEEGCRAEPRTMVVGASNLWFADTLSTIYLPKHQDKLAELISQHWGLLTLVEDADELRMLRKFNKLPAALESFTDAELIEKRDELRQLREAPPSGASEDLLTPEWRAFTDPKHQVNTDYLKLREVAVPQILTPLVERIVLAERLMENRAIVGFTRIEAPLAQRDDAEGAETMLVGSGSLSWVPATQVRGEGLFLQLNEMTLREVLHSPNIAAAEDAFLEAHRAWRERRTLSPDGGFPGMRYVLLHSLSHALIRQLALTCGYATASLRERIYCLNADDPTDAKAGVLIYTSAPDSEGTLGGLINLGRPEVLEEQVGELLASLEFCSSDPLCGEHEPNSEDDLLNGSACHACLHLPETSCERGNRYLDRHVLMEGIPSPTATAYI